MSSKQEGDEKICVKRSVFILFAQMLLADYTIFGIASADNKECEI